VSETTTRTGPGWEADRTDAAEPLHDVDEVVRPPRTRAVVLASLRPAALFIASRAVLLAIVGLTFEVGGPLVTGRYSGPWPDPPAHDLLPRALGSWDAAWYLSIAQHGYFLDRPPPTDSAVAFFPGWPVALRAAHTVLGLHLVVSGVVLELVAGTLAAVALWALTRELCGERVARRTVALWALFPGSYVLLLLYSEGLTLLFSAVCLLALLRKRWWIAGVAGLLATAVQPDALVLVVCGAWCAGAHIWRERRWRSLTSLAAPLLCVTSPLAYFAYLAHERGDFLLWYHVERTIWSSGDGFYNNTVFIVGHAFTRPGDLSTLIPAIGILWVVAGLVCMVLWRPPVVLWIFTVGALLAAFDSTPVGPRPRLLLVAFPLIIAVGRLARGWGRDALLGGSALLLCGMTIVTLTGLQFAP
jgi:hypothetical protein